MVSNDVIITSIIFEANKVNILYYCNMSLSRINNNNKFCVYRSGTCLYALFGSEQHSENISFST